MGFKILVDLLAFDFRQDRWLLVKKRWDKEQELQPQNWNSIPFRLENPLSRRESLIDCTKSESYQCKRNRNLNWLKWKVQPLKCLAQQHHRQFSIKQSRLLAHSVTPASKKYSHSRWVKSSLKSFWSPPNKWSWMENLLVEKSGEPFWYSSEIIVSVRENWSWTNTAATTAFLKQFVTG